MRYKLSALFLSLTLAASSVLAAEAPFVDVDKARYFLKEFEKEIERAHGASNTRYFHKQDALTRIKKLNQEYPDDPRVQELMKRASIAVQKSMGGFKEITPEMVAYKSNEAQMRQRIKGLNEEQWKKQLRDKSPLPKPFPAAVPEEVTISDYIGRYVALDDVKYPANQFMGGSGEYIWVGKPSSGYYFISMDGRAWAGAYEAVRRYRSMVDASIGDNLSFRILGRITDLVKESPDASSEKKSAYVWGWIVQPEMIYANDTVLAVYDSKNEKSGYFVGEDQVDRIKESWYTVKSVPDNVDPKTLMEIFATAIKEKNYQLYLECIYPERSKTDTGSSLLRYHWDLHQARYQNEYVYAEFDEPQITVIKGFDDSNDLDTYFLDAKQREQMNKMGGQKEEMAIVLSRAYDENGRQVGSKNRHELRRKGNGRWYVNTYDVRF
ncbi:MAG: hypothetical protein IJ523_05300 [Succinivibrionaceae bacterium]|nr:hypothetical protein [Succinivibrionaceae bacterium]